MAGQEPRKQFPLHFTSHTLPPPDDIIAFLARYDPDVAQLVIVESHQKRRLSLREGEGYSKATPILFALGGKCFGAIAALVHWTNFKHRPWHDLHTALVFGYGCLDPDWLDPKWL